VHRISQPDIEDAVTEWAEARASEERGRDLDRARTAVARWRDQNPEGAPGQLVAELGGQFHPDYGPVLRAVLFAVDSHAAKIATGVRVGLERAYR
jgi:hypothetical protein